MPKKIAKGFTLIELLVVVAIIGILSAIGVVAYGKYTKMAMDSAIKSNHSKIVNLVKSDLASCLLDGGRSGKIERIESSMRGVTKKKVNCNWNMFGGREFLDHTMSLGLRDPFFKGISQYNLWYNRTKGWGQDFAAVWYWPPTKMPKWFPYYFVGKTHIGNVNSQASYSGADAKFTCTGTYTIELKTFLTDEVTSIIDCIDMSPLAVK